MKDNLRISLIQTNIHWQDSVANLNMLKVRINALLGKTDVVILPEMFTTGFSMTPQNLAEDWPSDTLQWMQLLSKNCDLAICGSVMVKENDHYYNRFIWTNPSGEYYTYDKRHLFRMGREHEVYSAGKQPLVVKYKEWKIVPFICYDLRFPVWSRNIVQYDLAIYVANWPAARSVVWKTLLKARAIENQCYVAGVNRVGSDANGFLYPGNSMLVDARGDVLHELSEEEVFTYELQRFDLDSFRNKFPAYLDADQFKIENLLSDD